jgi:hypothetical protein
VGLEQFQRRFVMRVVGIDVCVEWARVNEECRYRFTSAARIS